MLVPNINQYSFPALFSIPLFARVILVFAIVITMMACSPVRSGNQRMIQDSNDSIEMGAADTLKSIEDTGMMDGSLGSGTNIIHDEPEDTLIINLQPLVYKYSEANNIKALEQQLQDISDMLDSGMTEQACSLSNGLWESLTEENEMKWHARYFMGECMVAKNDLDAATEIFEEIMASEAKKEGREKSIIRLGQIMCLKGNPSAAEDYFIQLRTDFPKSIYIPLAQCY